MSVLVLSSTVKGLYTPTLLVNSCFHYCLLSPNVFITAFGNKTYLLPYFLDFTDLLMLRNSALPSNSARSNTFAAQEAEALLALTVSNLRLLHSFSHT